MKVVVLQGGSSPEAAVSRVSAAGAAQALRANGHDVTCLELDARTADVLQRTRPDAVFVALHGAPGEDGTVQGMLEMLGIPYTHSGVRASATCMDKHVCRLVLADAGIPIAAGGLYTPAPDAPPPMPVPFVLKPLDGGSSLGVAIVRDALRYNDLPAALQRGVPVLAEAYVPGRELTVAVLEGRALGVTEIIEPAGAFYDYQAKYGENGARHVLPAPIPEAIAQAARTHAERAHAVLGCRTVSRTDFRLHPDGRLFALEVNTHPGLTPQSLLPEQAQHAGIAYNALVEHILRGAGCRGMANDALDNIA